MTDETPKIAKVILWANGMVMVFDRAGKQMPEFQGPESEAVEKLRAAGWTGTPERRTWGASEESFGRWTGK